MSRAATPQATKTPIASPGKPQIAAPTTQIPQEKIAQRAYEKWMKRGCPHGSDMQDWTEAEAELRTETGTASHKQGATIPPRR